MPLPDILLKRYKDWLDNIFFKDKKFYKKIGSNPQKPKTMIISCCDSRVNPTSIFKAKEGDIFVYRNIGNIIPSIRSDNPDFGMLAAIEYAVKKLKVRNIIILGHSDCGAIKHSYQAFSKKKKIKNGSSINVWVKHIYPAFKKLIKNKSEKNIIKSLEKNNIINSLNNLHHYPDIKEKISNNKLEIFGLWFDIGSGKLLKFNKDNNKFEKITY